MHRFSFFILLLASVSGPATALAQESSSNLPQQPVEVAPVQASAPQLPSDEVLAAEVAIAAADWKTADAKLTPWLTAHPEDARALFDAGYVADAENHLDEAAGFYRHAIAQNPKSFEAHLSLGLLLARENRPDEARPELIEATKLDPGEAGSALKGRAWRALAQIDRKNSDDEDSTTTASDDLLEALKYSPETPEDTLLAASLADQAGQPEQAEAAYRRLLAKDPKSAAANAGLAHLMIASKKFDEAEKLLRAALEQIPDDPALTAQLAAVLAAEDKAEALPLLQKLHASHPDDAAMTRMLAEVLAEAGDSAGSDALYVKLLATAGDDPALLVAHGQNLVRLGQIQQAFAAFDKATKIDPASADGWSGLAFAASRVNQPEVTIHALTVRSKFVPENASTYFLWATAYDALHQKAQAAAYYHHFLDASAGKYANQEWQAKQRLLILEK